MSVNVTLASGTTAADGSLMTPVMDPVYNCAQAQGTIQATMQNNNSTALKLFALCVIADLSLFLPNNCPHREFVRTHTHYGLIMTLALSYVKDNQTCLSVFKKSVGSYRFTRARNP